jgi:Arm domain-containing DNA-binding protein
MKPPSYGQVTYWDRGVGVRVSQGGSKTFVVLAASGKRRAGGRYPQVSLAEARQKAKLYVANATDINFGNAVDLKSLDKLTDIPHWTHFMICAARSGPI